MRPVIVGTVDPTQLLGSGQALESVVHCRTRAEIGEVPRRPDLIGPGLDPSKQARAKVAIGFDDDHVRNMRQVSDGKKMDRKSQRLLTRRDICGLPPHQLDQQAVRSGLRK